MAIRVIKLDEPSSPTKEQLLIKAGGLILTPANTALGPSNDIDVVWQAEACKRSLRTSIHGEDHPDGNYIDGYQFQNTDDSGVK